MNWEDFDVFCHVIEHGGFSGAARALERSKSTVSASVGRLEAALGARLLERTTRQVQPTERGEALYRSVGSHFRELREARTDALAQGGAVAGTLRIAAPYEFGAHHLAPVVGALMTRHPALSIRIDVEHATVNPLERRYDVVFAMLEDDLPASTIVQRRMFALERGVFAAPALLARHGVPDGPDALAGWPLLCGSADTEWRFTAADGTAHRVPVATARLRSGNADVRMQAAAAGLGAARITATFCAPMVADGRLVRLLPDHVSSPLQVYALLPGKQLMPPKVRVFLDALAGQAGLGS